MPDVMLLVLYLDVLYKEKEDLGLFLMEAAKFSHFFICKQLKVLVCKSMSKNNHVCSTFFVIVVIMISVLFLILSGEHLEESSLREFLESLVVEEPVGVP